MSVVSFLKCIFADNDSDEDYKDTGMQAGYSSDAGAGSSGYDSESSLSGGELLPRHKRHLPINLSTAVV